LAGATRWALGGLDLRALIAIGCGARATAGRPYRWGFEGVTPIRRKSGGLTPNSKAQVKHRGLTQKQKHR